MTLRLRILGILMVVILLYAVLSFGIQRLVVFPSFLALEQSEAEKDLTRCIEALRREIHHINTVAHDWAARDDTYGFVQNPEEAYVQSNLIPHSFADNHMRFRGAGGMVRDSGLGNQRGDYACGISFRDASAGSSAASR
ncbi:MAG: CHASE4 domain-containing protein [Thermodesulfobacteriota bacterium]